MKEKNMQDSSVYHLFEVVIGKERYHILLEKEELFDTVLSLPSCQTCGIRAHCRHCPLPGQTLRFNCFSWVSDDEKTAIS